MVKFIYNMENILSIKLKLEEQAKNEFGQAKLMLDQEILKLNAIIGKRQNYEKILMGEMEDKLNLREIMRCQEAIEILKYDIKIQKISLNAAKQKLELARIKLKEAMVERKVHEKLKESAFEEFRKEQAREEQKEVDQLVSFVYGKIERSER